MATLSDSAVEASAGNGGMYNFFGNELLYFMRDAFSFVAHYDNTFFRERLFIDVFSL